MATHRHFMSLIKGGHTHYQVRVSSRPVFTAGDRVDILVAFDHGAIEHDAHRLHAGSIVLADQAARPALPAGCPASLVVLDFEALAKKAGSPILANTVALGASGALLGLASEALDDQFVRRFGSKGEEVIAQNRLAYRLGWQSVAGLGLRPPGKPEKPPAAKRLLLHGDEAIAWGAVEAGARLFFAYPITPASEIMQWLAVWLPKLGGAVVQVEDEIAAINGAIGASLAGVRGWTATSGPGLSLMQEGIGIAAMTETPVVIVDAQRAGPATGLPTRPEQSDLNEVLYGSHGDQPRIVMSPATTADSFVVIQAAFNAAEKYQCPVIVLTDLNLALDRQTVDLAAFRFLPIERGEIDTVPGNYGPHKYPRFAVTEGGVSPRPIPGVPGKTFVATGDEHTPEGHITEDPAARVEQMRKRLRKLDGAATLGDEAIWYSGPPGADLVLVGFGGTYGPIAEAQEELVAQGYRVGHAHLRLLRPFPAAELARLLGAPALVVEQNATGQLAGEIRRQTGAGNLRSVLRFDGNPFTAAEIVGEAREVLEA